MNSPLKVFLIINNLDIGNHGGGAETFAANLALELRQTGVEVILGILSQYHSPNEDAWEHTLNKGGVEYRYLNPGPHRNLLRSIRKAGEICRTEKPSLLHSHCQIGSVIAVYLKQTRLPITCVRTVHAELEWGSGFIAFTLRKIFSQKIFPRFFDAQIAVSHSIRQRLENFASSASGMGRVYIIHNAIRRCYQKLALDQSIVRRFPQGKGWELISIGRLDKSKGFEDLLEAIPKVREQYPSIHLSIIGEGKLRHHLLLLAHRLRIERHVDFLGQRSDIPKCLLKSDLFILPSHYEGLPTVILEAMACGVPVIATRLPGVMEIIEDQKNGWLVEPGNPNDLAQSILHALSSPDKLNHVREAALGNLSRFFFDRALEEHLQTYKRLLND